MTTIKPLFDEYGIIFEASKRLKEDSIKLDFLEALAELEDNECHRTRNFPKTRLHKVEGIKQPVYRADIDKISGWRIHAQYINNELHLKDLIEPKDHNYVVRVINAKKGRYKL